MKIIKSIVEFIKSMREANYAANLARNGKIDEAQAFYTKSKKICQGV